MLLVLLSLVDSFGVSVTSVGLLIVRQEVVECLNLVLELVSEREISSIWETHY